jgi:hypothetical protein
MSYVTAALIVGGATVASAYMGGKAAGDAADTQAAAARQSAAAQERMFQKQIELQEPWRQAGQQALNKLTPLALNYEKFGMDKFQQDPGYAFRLSEGQKALERNAAARGGLISGSALKAATRYGQDMGSQEYTNAFNRYQTERAAQMQPLQSLAGVGQTSANTLSQGASNLGNQLGEAYTNAGNARASGYVGQANAITGGLNQYLNYAQNQQMMNTLAQNRNVGQYTPGSATYVGPMPQAGYQAPVGYENF